MEESDDEEVLDPHSQIESLTLARVVLHRQDHLTDECGQALLTVKGHCDSRNKRTWFRQPFMSTFKKHKRQVSISREMHKRVIRIRKGSDQRLVPYRGFIVQ